MKECRIYYATVIETQGRWARMGEKHLEPVQVEGRPPLGKAPELCCEDLKAATESFTLHIGGEHIGLQGVSSHFIVKINFCPFCGAKIVYIPDLKLEAVKHTRPIDTYYFLESK